jgi:predicted dienelactone hydrolase
MEVGCTSIYFRDTTRRDMFSKIPVDYRELSVRVWYPAVPEEQMQVLPYMKEDEAGYMSQFIIGPRFLLKHFNLVKTHSYENAPPRPGSYPLILYSPSGDMVQNTTVFQELASRGYVVFSVGHPYWNAFYYNLRGRAVPFDKNNAYYRAMWEEETSDSVNHLKELITVERDLDQKRRLQHKLNLMMPLEVADIRLWAEDLGFLLDRIESGDPSFGPLLNLMDVSRVGVIGFSKGGAAAGQFAVTDSRCRAGINLSGFMFGDVIDSPLEIPFMILENKEEWCQDCQPICEVVYEDAKNDAYMVRIEGARHGNFSDWSLVGKFLQLSGIIGPIKGSRCLEIQNNYIGSFFDRYLKGMDTPLLTTNHPDYPEVQFLFRIDVDH